MIIPLPAGAEGWEWPQVTHRKHVATSLNGWTGWKALRQISNYTAVRPRSSFSSIGCKQTEIFDDFFQFIFFRHILFLICRGNENYMLFTEIYLFFVVLGLCSNPCCCSYWFSFFCLLVQQQTTQQVSEVHRAFVNSALSLCDKTKNSSGRLTATNLVANASWFFNSAPQKYLRAQSFEEGEVGYVVVLRNKTPHVPQ